MDSAKTIEIGAKIASSLIFAALFWLHFDALAIRVEIKTVLRALGWILLAGSTGLGVATYFIDSPFDPARFNFWLTSFGFWLLYASFIFDEHSKLQFLAIVAIVATIFLKSHLLLATQAFLISITVLQISYSTKHKDLIPLVSGFILLTIGEFFYSLVSLPSSRIFADFMHFFAAIVFFYWLWQYLVIRFNLQKKLSG